MPPDASNKTKWQIEQRREFIEHRAFWRGRIGLADLMETFGVSRTQASLDINGYIKEFPDHLTYDKTVKTYVLGRSFSPHYASLDPIDHLSKLLALSQNDAVVRSDWEVFTPDMLAPPVPGRGADATTVRDVLLAIEQNRILHITYQSMSSPDPKERSIVPHALAHDGFRWHCRAHCCGDSSFKDFVLGRISRVEMGDRSEIDPRSDEDWRTEIDVLISPHPNLSASQRRVVASDYEMQNDVATLRVRKSMLFYALKRLGLDTDAAVRPAEDQHIVLVNPSEVFTALGRPVPC